MGQGKLSYPSTLRLPTKMTLYSLSTSFRDFPLSVRLSQEKNNGWVFPVFRNFAGTGN